MGLIGLFAFFQFAAPYFYRYFSLMTSQYLALSSHTAALSSREAARLVSEFALKSMALSLPFLLVTSALAVALSAAQTRISFSVKQLKPDFSRLSLFKGLKRLITIRSMTELLKSCIKIVVVAVAAFIEIRADIGGFVRLLDQDVLEALSFMAQMVYRIMIKVGLFLLAFGVLDYFYQWWDYERQIRMSHQDIKDEYKQTEGDPLVKGQQRERQRRAAMSRIAQKVPSADVIIRNPTHFAVAIQYDSKKDKAPKVIAKGQDYLALKIIEIAEAHHIPVTTNPPLARGIYQAVGLDQEIPEKFYQAVAEVLVFVYAKAGKKSLKK